MDDADLTIRVLEILGRIPGWQWRPHGPAYTDAEVALFYGPVGDRPDRAIGATIYGGTDPAVYAPHRRLQLRLRGRPGDKTGADTLADVAFTVLDRRPRGEGISSITRTSFGPLGADDNRREQRSDNYLIILDNLEASTS